MRFEDREDEIAEIGREIRIPNLGQKHVNQQSPSSIHYSVAYDDEMVEVISTGYRNVQLSL